MMSRHHIFNEGWMYQGNRDAKRLRDTPSLVPRIPREVHDELHEACPHVPLLGSHALAGTVKYFEPTGYTLQDMEGVMRAMERASRNPRAHMIERDLAGLAIEAIDLQRPWIRKGLLK